MTIDAPDIVILAMLAIALALWTGLASAEATLAEARAIAREPAGPRRLGRLFYELHRHPRRLLISLIVGRELALAGAAALTAGLGYRRYGLAGGAAALFLVVAVLIALRGLAAGRSSKRVASGHGTLGSMAGWLLRPLASLATLEKGVGRRLAHALLGEAPSGDNVFAPEELDEIEEGQHEEIGDSERALVAKAVRIDERTVRHVLTPRRDMVAVPVDVTSEALLQVIHDSGRARIPVYRGERDDIVGILYVKDLIGRPITQGAIEPLLRQPYVVSAEKPIVDLFRDFRVRKVHFALVVDEYASLVGLVTMEDLLEDLVGEIRDEFDDEEVPPIERRGPNIFVVSGRVPVHDFNTRLHLQLPESGAEATIAGIVIDRLGHVPARGESISMDGCTLTVEALDGTAIQRLRVELWPSSSSA